MQHRDLEVAHPGYEGLVGIGRRDISPPRGIYARNWGSASHETAEGQHRQLFVTVVAFSAPASDQYQIVATLDAGWWRTIEDEWELREAVLNEFQLDESQFLLHVSHTHSGPSLAKTSASKFGGDKVAGYREQVRYALLEATRDALNTLQPAVMEWHTGRCNLACCRDQVLPEGRTVVGYNPSAIADGTLLIGRITNGSGDLVAILVNYACHPTSLGWGNRSISPDYIGAMRETVEQATDGAYCVFFQAASGDLAPRRQYEADPAIADRNGKQLGHAVLSTYFDMLPPRTKFQFDRVEESAAPLGCWAAKPQKYSTLNLTTRVDLELPLKDLRITGRGASQMLRPSNDRASSERNERLRQMWSGFEHASVATLPVWLWRIGETVVIGVPAELHSPFQIALRDEFSSCAIVVMNLVNGTMGYLPPAEDFSDDTYQCQTSLFRAGADEIVLAACRDSIKQFFAPLRSGLQSHHH